MANNENEQKEASLALELVRPVGSGPEDNIWTVPLNLHVTQTYDDKISEETGQSNKESTKRLPLNLVVRLEQTDVPPINVTEVTLDKQTLKVGPKKPHKKKKRFLSSCLNPRGTTDSASSIETVDNALNMDLKFIVHSPVKVAEKPPEILDEIPDLQCPGLKSPCKASCTAECSKITTIQSIQDEDLACPGKRRPCLTNCKASCCQEYENKNDTSKYQATDDEASEPSDEEEGDYLSPDEIPSPVPKIPYAEIMDEQQETNDKNMEARLSEIANDHVVEKKLSRDYSDEKFNHGVRFPFLDHLNNAKQTHDEEIKNNEEITAFKEIEQMRHRSSDPPVIIDIGGGGGAPGDFEWFVQYCEDEMEDLDQRTQKMRSQLTDTDIADLYKLEKESKGAKNTFDGVVDDNTTKIKWIVERQLEITIVGKDIQVEMERK